MATDAIKVDVKYRLNVSQWSVFMCFCVCVCACVCAFVCTCTCITYEYIYILKVPHQFIYSYAQLSTHIFAFVCAYIVLLQDIHET